MTFPASSTGLQLWVRGGANVLSAVSPDVPAVDQALVRRWNDESGNGRNFDQSTAANKPIYYANATCAGQPAVFFDGATSILQTTAALSAIISASDFEILIVFKYKSANKNVAGFEDQDNAILIDAGGFLSLTLNTSNTLYAMCWDGSRKIVSKTCSFNATHVVCFRKTGGNHYISIDGGSESSVASGNITNLTNVLNLGWRTGGTGTNQALGFCAEVLIFNVARSSSDRNADIAALQAKYSGSDVMPIGNQWTSYLVLSGGRFDSCSNFGSGVMCIGSRNPAVSKLYKSTDYGASFSLIGTIGSADGITNIFSAGSGTGYLLDGDGFVFKTTDSGSTWGSGVATATFSRVAAEPRTYGLVVMPATGTVLVSDTNATTGGHIWRSTNGGASFTDLGAIGVSNEKLYRLQIVNSGAVICIGFSGRWYKSTDDGATWANKGQIVASPIFAVGYVPGTDIVFVASDAGHIYRSIDNAETWTDLGLIGQFADDFAVSGNTVYYTTYRSGGSSTGMTFLSTDLGVTWNRVGVSPTVGDPATESVEHLLVTTNALGGARMLGVTHLGYVMYSDGANLSPWFLSNMSGFPKRGGGM